MKALIPIIYIIKINQPVQIIIDIADLTPEVLFFVI